MKKIFLTTSALFIMGLATAQAQQTQIIAHRGFWKTENSAQNSITALQKAAQEQFFGSEFDIHITKDNVLVINHDADVNGIEIETNNYNKIAKVKLKNNEPLPTLENYLKAGKALPNIKLILEIKPHKNVERENQAVAETIQLVEKLNLANQVEYISFSQNICDQVKKQNPQAVVSYLNGDLSPQQVKSKGWDGIDYHFKIYQKNPTWITDAHNLGLITNTWTVNNPEVMEEMIANKIQFISTDEPLVLKAKLQN
ncbi:glycerophosphodiester phosphodiesterase [Flavobacterium agricola]|uniref:Glycerophosphodiester phosphodiesterase n=1 Tax=Flavobacterium agricola TaxID=2870839 RepID=A0ABY6M369_9FLAO|nr:glycerophosphodiester phosphodiesterase family protein [Flavobacterium agricola]UYW02265.1 glycerophosphodiester phosphodiesterase [Flavobacterium agricola]